MHDAGALPDFHVLAAGLRLDVIAEVDVGQEQNRLFGGNRVHHGHGVARGAKDVAFGLHLYRGVDVADDDVIGVAACGKPGRLRPGNCPPDCSRHSRSGTTTMRSGFSTFAVSAMKRTPQNAMTSPSNFWAIRRVPGCRRRNRQFPEFRLLIVVGEDNGAASVLSSRISSAIVLAAIMRRARNLVGCFILPGIRGTSPVIVRR